MGDLIGTADVGENENIAGIDEVVLVSEAVVLNVVTGVVVLRLIVDTVDAGSSDGVLIGLGGVSNLNRAAVGALNPLS